MDQHHPQPLLILIFLPLLLLLLLFQGQGQAETSKPHVVWVFFHARDECAMYRGGREALWNDEELVLEVHTLQRRRTRGDASKGHWQQGTVVGWNDLPVCPLWVEAVEATGATLRHQSRWLNAVSVVAEDDTVRALTLLPFVTSVEPVAQERRSTPAPRRRLSREYEYGAAMRQIQQVKEDLLHHVNLTGSGVIVEVIDSGFLLSHPSLADVHVRAQWDFIHNDTNTENCFVDECGEHDVSSSQHNHGTSVLSCIAGREDDMIFGAAFNAEFLLAKTEELSFEEPSEEDNLVAALEWGEQRGADIASISLGYSLWYSQEDLDGMSAISTIAVQEAVARGMIVVVAAGNEGSAPQTLTAPADAPGAITVGAVDMNGRIASFSSRGPNAKGRIKPDIVARGVSAFIALANSGDQGWGSGTSFATPIITAGIAQLLELHEDWTPADVMEAITTTSNRANAPDNTYGYGLADFAAATCYGWTEERCSQLWKDTDRAAAQVPPSLFSIFVVVCVSCITMILV